MYKLYIRIHVSRYVVCIGTFCINVFIRYFPRPTARFDNLPAFRERSRAAQDTYNKNYLSYSPWKVIYVCADSPTFNSGTEECNSLMASM